ncbi:MAG: hypothetical protein KDA60_23220, partial [Planctomycetales bacterium]|nr:hypothetical protein [Planctomycetales bacterium]
NNDGATDGHDFNIWNRSKFRRVELSGAVTSYIRTPRAPLPRQNLVLANGPCLLRDVHHTMLRRRGDARAIDLAVEQLYGR